MNAPLCYNCKDGLFALDVFDPHKGKIYRGCACDSRITDYVKASTLCPLLSKPMQVGCSKTNLKTPAQWCEKFGVTVLDPDGWDRSDPKCMDYPINQDEFIAKFHQSTGCISDRAKYLTYKHLFG